MRITSITGVGCVLKTDSGTYAHLTRENIAQFLDRVSLYLSLNINDMTPTHKGVLLKDNGGVYVYVKGKEALEAEAKLRIFLEVDERVFGTKIASEGCLIELFVKEF